MTLPDRFYPIFDSADWVARGLAAGARFIQLRIKELEGADLQREIGHAQERCAAAGATLVVNDHWREAIAAGAPWVHLGQEDLVTADLPAIRAAGLKLGLSTHDEAELATALAAAPDYVALGPVFPTILKKMKWAPQGYARLAEWKGHIGALPLVAIGGFTPERAGPAFEAGADCVAAVTDITLNADPEGRIREWIAATRPADRKDHA